MRRFKGFEVARLSLLTLCRCCFLIKRFNSHHLKEDWLHQKFNPTFLLERSKPHCHSQNNFLSSIKVNMGHKLKFIV